MSKFQRLTRTRIERLRGAVVKNILFDEIPEDKGRHTAFLSPAHIQFEDGRCLVLMVQETEGMPEVSGFILPRQKGGK